MVNKKSLTAINIIRKTGHITRQTLAQRMEISLSLVNKLTADLLEAGIVERVRKPEREMGRPADLLSISADAGFVVGCEIQDQSQIMVVTDLGGTVVSSSRHETRIPTERNAMLQTIKGMVDGAIAGAVPKDRPVLGVGVAVYGIVDAVSGAVDGWAGGSGFMNAWLGLSLRDAIAGAIDYPVILVEDVVRPLGVAESLFGRASREKNFIYAIADEAIGMAFMQGGKPYIGFSHIAGEIAHIPVGPEDRPCACGSSGCLCTMVCIGSIRGRLRQHLSESPIRSVLRDRSDQVTIAEVVQAAVAGDKLAVQLMAEFGEYYGKAVAVVLNLFGPELVVLGGTLAGSESFMEAVRRTARMRALQRATKGVEIERSSLDELGAARGAAAMVLDSLFETPGRNILTLAARGAAG
jgi:predicted NBD/HSP70 family sugar kinase